MDMGKKIMVHPKSKIYSVPVYRKENKILKRLYLIMLILALTSLMLRAQPFPGSGTSGDPYQIGTAAQLDSLRNPTWGATSGLYFILTANIDLSGYANWIPIPTLKGQLDGQWHKISNMTITSIADTTAANYNIGLFGFTYLASGTPLNTRNFKHIILYKPRIDIDQQTLVNQEIGRAHV